MLVIHLGENGGAIHGAGFAEVHEAGLEYAEGQLGEYSGFWTRLLPRRVWRGAERPSAINKARKERNREMSDYCQAYRTWASSLSPHICSDMMGCTSRSRGIIYIWKA